MTEGRVPPYPAVPQLVAMQLEVIAAENAPAEDGEPEERTDYNTGEESDGPVTRPWDLGALHGAFADAVYGWLDEVVLWMNQCYGWQEHQLIPACWNQHFGLSLDLAALAFNRLDIYKYDSPAYVARWHGEWDDLQRRMSVAFGDNDGRDCRKGQHSDPGNYGRAPIRQQIQERIKAAE